MKLRLWLISILNVVCGYCVFWRIVGTMLSPPSSFFSSEDTFITYEITSLVLIIIYIVSVIIIMRIHNGLMALCFGATLLFLILTPVVMQIL